MLVVVEVTSSGVEVVVVRVIGVVGVVVVVGVGVVVVVGVGVIVVVDVDVDNGELDGDEVGEDDDCDGLVIGDEDEVGDEVVVVVVGD